MCIGAPGAMEDLDEEMVMTVIDVVTAHLSDAVGQRVLIEL